MSQNRLDPEAWRWSSVEAAARSLSQSGINWAVCNGVDVEHQTIGRDVDVWVDQGDVARALPLVATALRDCGWPSVWYKYTELLHQLVAFRLESGRPITLAFDFMSDPDFWSTRGVYLATEPMVFDHETLDPFVFSAARTSIKTRVMPLLRGDFVKFLDTPPRVLRRRDFEALVESGLMERRAFVEWSSTHEAIFDHAGVDRAARKRGLAAASRELRYHLWMRNLRLRPRWLKAYFRKAVHYVAAPFAFPPVSLAVRADVPRIARMLETETEGTYIDVLHSYGAGRRLLPMKPTIGLAVHLGPATGSAQEISFASDSWGASWRRRLGHQLPAEIGSATDGGVYRAVQYVFDSLYSV